MDCKYVNKIESLGKAMTRLWGYNHIKRRDLYSKFHIVIASRDCGDIRDLLRFGVSPDRIIACDIDPVALAQARKFGVRISPHPRIEDTVPWACRRYRVASINVDLCETLSKTAAIVAKVLAARAPITLFTYRRGRDPSVLKAYPGLEPNAARFAFLKKYTKTDWDAHESYTSNTRTAKGSTMGVCVFFRKKHKKKKYRCHDCNKVGSHPMIHRKRCKARVIKKKWSRSLFRKVSETKCDCGAPSFARGKCRPCYMQWYSHGGRQIIKSAENPAELF